ncbi:hypothetical protein BRD56_02595 [Thermoplasmatales archaeon SW_10_69_26]|nr:MAG: hypothetical protein BRD56_02595 [Thermoplasmatales archaeon SW_10_69_26]
MDGRWGERGSLLAAAVAVLAAVSLVVPAAGQLPLSPWGQRTTDQVDVVGHSPLDRRGMNSALAVGEDHAYVGYRADGTHAQAGVLVVDVSDPSQPEVVDRIAEPHHAQPGESSRELRLWPDAGVLIVLDIPCDPAAHACYNAEDAQPDAEYELYDVSGAHAEDPEHLATYDPRDTPHEFHLWIDPSRPSQRALLFQSTPHGDHGELLVAELSPTADGLTVEEGPSWDGGLPGSLHSLSVHPDGTRAYLAHSEGGMAVLDTSALAADADEPQMQLVTSPEDSARWGSPGAHSAVKVPDRPYVWTTDETYGWYAGLGNTPVVGFSDVITGCPWSWARAIDLTDPAHPQVRSEFKIEENTDSFCRTPEGQVASNTTSYSSHNPTVTPNLALHTWYAGGVVVADISDPGAPEQVAQFRPEPLPAVAVEDPALTQGPVKVGMWSYPVVQDGLVYVVDIRNGLYVLDYEGPHEDEVEGLSFYESNSNRGDAAALYGSS